MQLGTLYMHEDEWAMIDLLPSENFGEILRIADEAQTFGEEHFDGSSWTALYVLPKPTYPLSLRALPFKELRIILSERFLRVNIVESFPGEVPSDSFAFVEMEKADGAFYGVQKNGLVTQLHLFFCNEENRDGRTCFLEILQTLGTKYNLVLVDWWNNTIINLRERRRVVQYLETSSHQE